MKQELKEQNQSMSLLRREYLHVPKNKRIPLVHELEQMPSLLLALWKEYGRPASLPAFRNGRAAVRCIRRVVLVGWICYRSVWHTATTDPPAHVC
jgi:hypothetical protein